MNFFKRHGIPGIWNNLIRVDSSRKRTLRGKDQHALVRKRALSLLTAVTVLFTPLLIHSSAYANSYSIPNLLITEIAPDTYTASGSPGQPDAFEFIELYNTTDSAIDLQNYRIIYNNGSEVTWTIREDKEIEPKSTFVVRILAGNLKVSDSQFRANYDVSDDILPDSQITVITADGMANSSSRTISLRAPGSSTTDICSASYTSDNILENIGIPYLYPTDGTVNMRKLTTDTSSIASPGTVFEGQVPPDTWDDSAPEKPAGLTAVPGDGKVTLNWNSGSESDLAFYRTYVNSTYNHTYRRIYDSAIVADYNGKSLVEEKDYTFAVGAVDTSNNLSEKASVISYPLAKALTAEDTLTTPSGLYPEFFNFSAPGAYVPGLKQDLISQGMAFIPASRWPAYPAGVYVISQYRQDKKSSMLSFINAADNTFIKSVVLYNADRTAYSGHCGGVAASKNYLWVASDSYLRRLPIQSVIEADNRTKVFFADRFKTTSNASFCFYSNGILWSGEFYYASGYPTDDSHQSTARDGTTQNAWISGYKLDASDLIPADKYVNDSTAVTPDYILSTTNKVQSACQLLNGQLILTRSYGRNSYSSFYFYNNVLSEPAHSTRTVNGVSVPLWYLDEKSMKSYQEPNLMITEVVPDSNTASGSAGDPDAYEYVELYNSTNKSISLKNYSLVYSSGAVRRTWKITENKSIPSQGTFVVRILPNGITADNNSFRSNYGVAESSLPDSQITVISAEGMSHNSDGTISLQSPGRSGKAFSKVSYTASDIVENMGIRFLCPRDNSINMRKMATGVNAKGTPGTVEDCQVNPGILTAPPLLEGVLQKNDDSLIVNFESGATAYRDGACPVDNLYTLDLSSIYPDYKHKRPPFLHGGFPFPFR